MLLKVNLYIVRTQEMIWKHFIGFITVANLNLSNRTIPLFRLKNLMALALNTELYSKKAAKQLNDND